MTCSITSSIHLSLISYNAQAEHVSALSRSIQNLTDLILTLRASLPSQSSLVVMLEDAASHFTRAMSKDTLNNIYQRLSETTKQDNKVRYILGIEPISQHENWVIMSRSTSKNSGTESSPPGPQSPRLNSTSRVVTNHQDIKYTKYNIRYWEMMQDSTPNPNINDSAINLQLFSARKVL